MDQKYIAHIDGNRIQSVEDHLKGVAKLAAKFAKPLALAPEAEIIGKYHDLGKLRTDFQRYIRGEYKGRIDHSSIGGKLFLSKGGDLGIVGAFCIAGHHCGLQNMYDGEKDGLFTRMHWQQ